MPIPLSCTGCQYRFQVKDELAGKRIKCPKCGTVLAVRALTVAAPPVKAIAPAPPRPAPPTPPPLPPKTESAPEAEKPGAPADNGDKKPRKKKKKKKKADWPELILFGFKVTILRVILLLAVPAALLYFLWPRNRDMIPEVQVVDAYAALNELTHLTHEHAKFMVTRENPNGKHLLVSMYMSQKWLDRRFGDKVAIVYFQAGDFKLQADEAETVKCLYLVDKYEKPEEGYSAHYKDPKKEFDGFDKQGKVLGVNPSDFVTSGPRLQVGPYPGEPWTVDGKFTANKDEDFHFLGKEGLSVDIVNHKESEKPYMQVTWDKRSIGWMSAPRVDNPNNIVTGWEIRCIFPRPRAGRSLNLLFQDKPIPLDLKYAEFTDKPAPPPPSEEEKAKKKYDEGLAALKRGDRTTAMSCFQAAVSANPKLAGAWVGQGQILSEMGKHDQALQTFTEAIKLDSKNLDAFRGRGAAFLAKGASDKSIEDFRRTTQIEPQNPRNYADLAGAYVRIKEYENAVTQLSTAIRLAEKDPEYYLKRAEVYRLKGDDANYQADLREVERLKKL